MKWKEIKTLEEFNEIKKTGIGYVIITDNSNPNRIHHCNCDNINVEYFMQKIIKNNCKNGNYYWTKDKELAKSMWNTETCLHCKHLL